MMLSELPDDDLFAMAKQVRERAKKDSKTPNMVIVAVESDVTNGCVIVDAFALTDGIDESEVEMIQNELSDGDPDDWGLEYPSSDTHSIWYMTARMTIEWGRYPTDCGDETCSEVDIEIISTENYNPALHNTNFNKKFEDQLQGSIIIHESEEVSTGGPISKPLIVAKKIEFKSFLNNPGWDL